MRLLAVLAVAALMVVPSVAVASEHDENSDETEEPTRFAAVVDAAYDEMLQVLIFAINTADADPVDCTVPDDVVLSRGDDAESGDVTVTVDEGEWSIPDGCTVLDVRGPNGQVNHGQVVSSFVHALKALDRSMIDVPFGQLVRQIAGSDLGKIDKNAADDVDLDDDDAEDDDGNGPPPHANNDKDKKPKSNGSNNGNGRGPNR